MFLLLFSLFCFHFYTLIPGEFAHSFGVCLLAICVLSVECLLVVFVYIWCVCLFHFEQQPLVTNHLVELDICLGDRTTGFCNFPNYGIRLPWCFSWSRIHLQCRRPWFNSWVWKIPWRRERLPTPVLWPGEFQRLYSPWGHKEWDTFCDFHFQDGINIAAKSLQSCLTLCNPVDGSPPGSPFPGILQARTLEWVAISSSNA